MNRVHLVGRKNHGKTSLLVELIAEYRRRGLQVGSIKHSGHQHELDTPGKDSQRHGSAGASPSAIVTPEQMGLFLPRPANQDPYRKLAAFFAECALVLVEGDIEAEAPKVEVWRDGLTLATLASERMDILAVISDDRPQVTVPVWPRHSVPELADRLLDLRGSSGV